LLAERLLGPNAAALDLVPVGHRVMRQRNLLFAIVLVESLVRLFLAIYRGGGYRVFNVWSAQASQRVGQTDPLLVLAASPTDAIA
jgi:hypothetical protein